MTQNEENSNRLKGLLSDNGTLQFDSDYCELCGCYLDGDFHVRDENFPHLCDECGEDVELPSMTDDPEDTPCAS